MRNKSELVFACIMGAFFAVAILVMPDKSNDDFQASLTQNTNSFAANLAADYNDAVAAGTVGTTDGLADIAPAAGDATSSAAQVPAVQTQAVETPAQEPAQTAPAVQETPVAQ